MQKFKKITKNAKKNYLIFRQNVSKFKIYLKKTKNFKKYENFQNFFFLELKIECLKYI